MSEVQVVESSTDNTVILETVEQPFVLETGDELNAATNAQYAEAARDAALISEQAALASEQAAAASEAASLASQQAALSSAVDAQGSEDEAELWARSLVLVDATYYGARKYALDADASAIAAAISAAAALASEQASAASQAAASLSEGNALASANAAGTSETNAAASEAAALASQTAAAASKAAAGLSETAAGASETAANLSAVDAQSSEDEAQQWAVSLTEVEPGLYGARKYSQDASTSESASLASANAAAISEANADADATATAADRVATDADATATAADRVQTGLDRVATGADAAATAADLLATDADTVATAADRVQTGLDTTATAADRVQTGLDRTAASGSAAAALVSEGNASASASAASTSETNAAASEVATGIDEAKAGQWANAAQDIEVEPGLYSALHWSLVAQQTVLGTLIYRGTWDASTGSFPVSPADGDFYKVSVQGTIATVTFKVGDHIVYNGTAWDHIDNTESVSSVGGYSGAITASQVLEAVKTVDGPGSGLDADTVDGIPGPSLLRSDEPDTHRIEDIRAWPNATPSDPQAWNQHYALKFEAFNNALAIITDSTINARRFGLQSGHTTGLYADNPGILELNPFGGEVKINGYSSWHEGNLTVSATAPATPSTNDIWLDIS